MFDSNVLYSAAVYLMRHLPCARMSVSRAWRSYLDLAGGGPDLDTSIAVMGDQEEVCMIL